jgi:hypothetical protein
MSVNLIEIVNLKNENFNFSNILNVNNSLMIKNCSDVKINVTNKINKITIENCHKVHICISKLISGFEISKSSYILISCDNDNRIPSIELYKATVYLVGDINNYKDVMIRCESSDLYHIVK